MKHFKNISLEKYVPNNWLRMHGIPARRTRQIIKQFKKQYWSKNNGSVKYMLDVDDAYMFTEMRHAQYEKMFISGRISEEQFQNLMYGGIVFSFKKARKYHITQTISETDIKEDKITPSLPLLNF